jgi:hypothetical protein
MKAFFLDLTPKRGMTIWGVRSEAEAGAVQKWENGSPRQITNSDVLRCGVPGYSPIEGMRRCAAVKVLAEQVLHILLSREYCKQKETGRVEASESSCSSRGMTRLSKTCPNVKSLGNGPCKRRVAPCSVHQVP